MRHKKLYWLIPLFLTFLIFFNSSRNGMQSASLSQGIAKQLYFGWIPYSFFHFLLRKASHFIEYFGLSLSVQFAQHKHPLKKCIIFFYGPIVAILDEFLQFMTPGRSGQFSDVLLDSFAYFFALLLSLLLYFKKRKV